MLGPCFVLQSFMDSSFVIISLGKEELVAVLLLCSECLVPVFFTLPHGAMNWPVVCDHGISW